MTQGLWTASGFAWTEVQEGATDPGTRSSGDHVKRVVLPPPRFVKNRASGAEHC